MTLETQGTERSYFDRTPNRFINRELSWLEFNDRVLKEAGNPENPLLERLKFLSISASNLDEFFMVRVAGLKHLLLHNPDTISQDGLTPAQQLQQITKRALQLLQDQGACWRGLIQYLRQENIVIETPGKLTEADRTWLADYIAMSLQPYLVPFILGSHLPFPLLPNLAVGMIAVLKPKKGKVLHVLIPLPTKVERFIKLPSIRNLTRFIGLDHVLELYQQEIFPEHKVESLGFFRITRDSELDISDESEDLVNYFERMVEKRKHGGVIRIEVNRQMPVLLRKILLETFHASKNDIVEGAHFPGLVSLGTLYSQVNRPDLKFPPFHARFPERINAFAGDCFAAIDAKDIIVHHPYESFDVVIKFLRQAARDPAVVSIHQTLYRTGSDSEIVKALIEAAGNGKEVTAIVELKARFDEESNIRWAKTLKQAGATVIFGVSGLKTHAKMSLIVRREGDKERSYVHFGTGNYHSVTAKLYVDLSFFTCDPVLCEDAAKLFLYMKTNKMPASFNKLIVAPFILRQSLIKMIREESDYAKEGKPAAIWVKVNALVDGELIDALYSASQAGVKIELIVRGICTLRPGIPGFSDNITVKSIVGRFLEHSRIFCFGGGHGLPSPQAKVFMSSADWMYRSCNRRVEAVVPIENPTVHAQVMDQIMASNLKDNQQSWQLQSDGSYHRLYSEDHFSAQEYFMINRSLSGISSPVAVRHPVINVAAGSSAVGVIDIGSNSVRLVVYDALKRVPMTLFNEKMLCGLARDLEGSGTLSKEGVILANEALARFIHLARMMHVVSLHIFATAAVRDAADGSDFVTQIEARHKVKIRILSGEEEAKFGAWGILSSIPEAQGIIGDLGGGSLEVSYLKDHEVSLLDSYPIGLLRVINAANGDKKKATQLIDRYLTKFPLAKTDARRDFYAVGGGFRTLAKIYIALTHYPVRILHHYTVPADKFLTIIRNISRIPLQTLQELSGISGKRAETLPYTALIMERLLMKLKPVNVVFSAYGVREGFLYAELSEKQRNEDPLLAACTDMIYPHGETVDYTNELMEWMAPLFNRETVAFKRLRQAVCILNSIARYEHTEYRAEIAYRRFLDSSITGIDHNERLYIACALFYRYKTNMDVSVMQAATILLEDDVMHDARIIGLAMRLAHNISASMPGILSKTRLILSHSTLVLQFDPEVTDLIGEVVRKRLEKLAVVMQHTGEIQVSKL